MKFVIHVLPLQEKRREKCSAVLIADLAESTLSAEEKCVIVNRCSVQHQEQLTADERFNGFSKFPSLRHREELF